MRAIFLDGDVDVGILFQAQLVYCFEHGFLAGQVVHAEAGDLHARPLPDRAEHIQNQKEAVLGNVYSSAALRDISNAGIGAAGHSPIRLVNEKGKKYFFVGLE